EVMVPSTFTLLGALPLTPNGKVDRAALPAPEKAGAEGYLAPRTPTEERLAAIWAELLGVERVGASDDFFELGGHSLLVGGMIRRIREGLSVQLTPRMVFEHLTLSELAAAIARLAAPPSSAPSSAAVAESPLPPRIE